MADFDDELESEQGPELASNDTPIPAPSSMPASMPAPQAPVNPVLANYLQSKQDLKAAQAQASQNDFLTGIARASASLSSGLAHSDTKVDNAPFDAMAASDQAPVKNFMEAQKAGTTNLEEQQKMATAQKTAADEDPNSPASMAKKALVQKLYPGKFSPEDLAQISAADIGESVLKPLELDAKIQASKEDRAGRYADRRTAAQDKIDTKQTAEHDKYLQHTEDAERGWRSDPASQRYDAQLAAAANGKTLIDRYRGREDEMPIQDIHALVSDRLKAITGATPTEKEIEAQMPSSAMGTRAHPIDSLMGKLHPAMAGDFVRNIDNGFKELEKTARAGLINRQTTVASSPKLTPEERERLVKVGVPLPVYSDDGQTAPAAQNPPQADLHNAVQEEIARRKMQRARSPQSVPQAPSAVAQGTPGYAHGGVVGCYSDGGRVPGIDDPRKDTATIKATPGEVVLPLSVTRAKDPALAAYLFMKNHVKG